jgi:hypothetical protein
MISRRMLSEEMIKHTEVAMAANDYHFVSHWHVPGTPEECFTIIQDGPSLPHWWPSAFVGATPATFSDGSEATRLDTKGWMPYILHWNVKKTSEDRPRTFTNDVEGDFNGRGIWILEEEDTGTHITYDWTISVNKFGVKQLSGLLKPLFASNHRWAMRKGEISLGLELARRRNAITGESVAIPAPPAATRLPKLPLIAGAALVGLVLRRRHKSAAKAEGS